MDSQLNRDADLEASQTSCEKSTRCTHDDPRNNIDKHQLKHCSIGCNEGQSHQHEGTPALVKFACQDFYRCILLMVRLRGCCPATMHVVLTRTNKLIYYGILFCWRVLDFMECYTSSKRKSSWVVREIDLIYGGDSVGLMGLISHAVYDDDDEMIEHYLTFIQV